MANAPAQGKAALKLKCHIRGHLQIKGHIGQLEPGAIGIQALGQRAGAV
jgi:hypothetical protein